MLGRGITETMTRTDRLISALDRLGIGMTLLMPVFLTHGRVFSEIAMDVLAIGLLIRSGLGSGHSTEARIGWGWGRQFWVRVALLWWVWQIVCSLPHIGLGSSQALTQACLAIRFPLMAAAMQVWTLRLPSVRGAMRWVLVICCLYFVLQFVIQAVFGHNLFGYPRYIDGTLTGPYAHPRAAAPFSRLVLPVMMLGCAGLVARSRSQGIPPARAIRLQGFVAMSLLAIAVMALMVLAGQRIPTVLTVLGIAVCAAFYRPMRPAAIVAACSLPVLVLMVRFLAPQAFHHLVILAADQMTHFWQSQYGQVFTRAIIMAQYHPVTGLGYDAFRHACSHPIYHHGLPWFNTEVDGGGRTICVQHAHNHYLQALTNAGVPGLFLFSGFVFACLRALWPWRGAHQAWRIGLFAAFFVQEWPLASASDFLNLPLGGWAFMLLGVGLAEARHRIDDAPEPEAGTHAGSPIVLRQG